MNENIFTDVSKRIDLLTDSMIELQKQLTSIPAICPSSGGTGEFRKAQLLIQYLKNSGFSNIQTFDAPDPKAENGVRPNVIARIPGTDSSFTVWIMSHLDIVSPGELKLWESDPYVVRIADGKLFGRGVEDNQQGVVASIFAAKALIEQGITPACNVGLLFVADEETGSEYGVGYLLNKHPELFSKNDIFIVPDAGNEEGSMIEVAEKSILWIRFKTLGKQCHGSMPQIGKNAHKAAAFLITKLQSLYRDFPESNPLFTPPISTFEPTKKDANVENINIIPGEDVFFYDCRIMPDVSVEKVIKKIASCCRKIEKQFGVAITYEFPQRADAAPPTPAESRVVTALKKGIKRVYNVEASAQGIGGGTVAAHLRRLGYHAAVWSKLDECAHQPNEYCKIENMVNDAKVMAHVMLMPG
jgi:succinyl-diaminopimelate desuccinylase